MMELAIMGISPTRPKSMAIKFPDKRTSKDDTDEKNRAFKQFRGKMQGGKQKIGFQKMKAIWENGRGGTKS